MKKIGFIDFFLDEWHANNYPQWIRERAAATGQNYDVAYAWAEIDRPGGIRNEDWCKRHGVQFVSSMEALVELSDAVIVLSPDHPEHHERLSGHALTSGKPVYIDKTFSPDLKTGVRIVEWAARHHTPFFSSSALRFAQELRRYPNDQVNRSTIEYVAATGHGAYDNYSVHQWEMLVSLLGTGAVRMKSFSAGKGRMFIVDYKDGRRASMHQLSSAPFQVSIQLRKGEGVFIGEVNDMFPELIKTILHFFDTGIPPVPMEETLEIMSLIDSGYKAMVLDDTWVTVEQV